MISYVKSKKQETVSNATYIKKQELREYFYRDNIRCLLLKLFH